MVTHAEKMLWPYKEMRGEERNSAIKEMWCRLMDEYTSIPLWENGAPLYDPAITDQKAPSIVLMKADSPTPRGTVLVAAGGGYVIKSPFEAFTVAEKLVELGLNAAVLDYRIVPYTIRTSIGDAQRALRLMRLNAKEYGIDPDHIGMMGFSAGGHLTGMCATHFDAGDPYSDDPVERASSRPDAAILCYGSRSRTAVPGGFDQSPFSDQDREEKIYLSTEKNLRHDGPPFFLWQTNGQDDPRHIARLAIELTDRGIPFEMHCFPMGRHGMGLVNGDNEDNWNIPHVARWINLCVEWLESLGF